MHHRSLVFALLAFGLGTAVGEFSLRADEPARHPVVVENPPGVGTLDTGLRDASGARIGVECATCHAAGVGPAFADREGAPAGFHTVELRHGEGALTCDSCHDPDDRTRLRLANGQTLEIGDVVSLCGQCHGTQYRSFRHGAHGGARGYWDLSQGPRIRNSCVACHPAHAPAYPLVAPAPPPNDRFLPPPHDAGAAAGVEFPPDE